MSNQEPAMTISERLIERWHSHPFKNDGKYCELHEYLGLSWQEYGDVVLHPDAMDELVKERNPEFTAHIENTSQRSIDTLAEAWQFIAEATDDSFSLASSLTEGLDGLDEDTCLDILTRLKVYSDAHPNDEGFSFGTYHDIRLLREAYLLVFDSLSLSARPQA